MIIAKEYILSQWGKYNIVDSRDEMIALLNILDAHGENLDTMHDVYMGNTDEVCSIWITSDINSDRDTWRIIQNYNVFYPTYEAMIAAFKIAADDEGETVEKYMEYEDITKTEDGYVRKLWY